MVNAHELMEMSMHFCSYDGVPFLMHDETLRRTTNVEEVFPELAYKQSSMFNWTDLEKLNAGGWFLKVPTSPKMKSDPTI